MTNIKSKTIFFITMVVGMNGDCILKPKVRKVKAIQLQTSSNLLLATLKKLTLK